MLINNGSHRESQTVNDIAFGIMDRCLEFFNKMWPEIDDETLFKSFDTLMLTDASGDKAYGQVTEAIKNGVQLDANKAALMITEAYVVEALQADARGEITKANRVLMDSSFWCGLMWSGQDILKAKEKGAEIDRKKISEDGNKARWEKRNKIIDVIYLHVVRRGEEKIWHSCASAAGIIHGRLNEILSENGADFGVWRPKEGVIEEWLLKMPNSDHLFETKAKRLRQK